MAIARLQDSRIGITPSRLIPPLSERDCARFWAKVEKSGGCWLWRGTSRRDTGYGFFSIQFDTPYGRATGLFSAHRVAYTIARGEIPRGLELLHSCDRRSCVRPDHLRPGTALENAADKMERDRHPRGGRVPGITLPREALPAHRGERHYATKISDEQVLAMRTRYFGDSECLVSALAREYGLSSTATASILRGLWRRTAGGPTGLIRPVIGSRVPGAKLTADQVAGLRARFAGGETIYDLAPVFGLAPQTVSKIIRRTTWKHVPDIAPLHVRRGHRKLTKGQVTKIRQRHAAGASQARLASDYRVSRAAICLLVNHKTHA